MHIRGMHHTLLVFFRIDELIMQRLTLFDEEGALAYHRIGTVLVFADAGRLMKFVNGIVVLLYWRLDAVTLLNDMFDFQEVSLIGQINLQASWRGVVSVYERALVSVA
jgi:hypothetical protein